MQGAGRRSRVNLPLLPLSQVLNHLAGVPLYTNEDLINSKHLNIYQKKIKFSEGGAKKLAADFAFFRQWVDSTTLLTPDSKRYLLSLT